MEPYFEFYSDLDLLIEAVEQLREKCFEWWCDDTPFNKEIGDEIWKEFEDKLQEVQDILEGEPFFTTED